MKWEPLQREELSNPGKEACKVMRSIKYGYKIVYLKMSFTRAGESAGGFCWAGQRAALPLYPDLGQRTKLRNPTQRKGLAFV